MSGKLRSALLLSIVLLLIVPTGAVGAVVTDHTVESPSVHSLNEHEHEEGEEASNETDTADEPEETEQSDSDDDSGEEGEHEEGSGDREPPSSAEIARITPVELDAEHIEIETEEHDSVFNTRGPYVIFSVSEPLDAVRISQSGGSAQLLSEHVVLVEYEKDAAPDPQDPSLYTLELFYLDESAGDVELYATGTDVSLEATQLSEYRRFIYEIRDDARQSGYDGDAEGVQEYYEDTKEMAEQFDSLFVEQATRAWATAISWFTNPFAIGITIGVIALGSYYRYVRRGYALEVISNDSGKVQRLRERLRLWYAENQQTANEQRLSELPQISSVSEIYWRDAQDVSTVYQLAELSRVGKVVERDGELIHEHHGASDLNPADLEQSWLETVAGPGRQRISSYDIALGHMKIALDKMISQYGMGHIYQETYDRVVELIDQRQHIVREGVAPTRSGTSSAPSAGDD